MLFFCYPKCSTCQKAQKILDSKNISYISRNIKEENPTYDELKMWYHQSEYPLKKFFNTSGIIYKEKKLKDKIMYMSEEEQLKLLSENGMLIKRPIIVETNKIIIGFNQKEYEKLQ